MEHGCGMALHCRLLREDSKGVALSRHWGSLRSGRARVTSFCRAAGCLHRWLLSARSCFRAALRIAKCMCARVLLPLRRFGGFVVAPGGWSAGIGGKARRRQTGFPGAVPAASRCTYDKAMTTRCGTRTRASHCAGWIWSVTILMGPDASAVVAAPLQPMVQPPDDSLRRFLLLVVELHPPTQPHPHPPARCCDSTPCAVRPCPHSVSARRCSWAMTGGPPSAARFGTAEMTAPSTGCKCSSRSA